MFRLRFATLNMTKKTCERLRNKKENLKFLVKFLVYGTKIVNNPQTNGEFQQTKIPADHLRKIVETAIAAPSGCNKQTTSFIIVDDDGLIASLGEITANKRSEEHTSELQSR